MTDVQNAPTAPTDGEQRRAWIRYELQRKVNPESGKPWTQADIARGTWTSEPTVSLVYTGERVQGLKAERVRRKTAEVLELPEEAIFGVITKEPRKARQAAEVET